MRTSLKTRLLAIEQRTPSRIITAAEQLQYWTMMSKVYGSKDDPEPKLEDFSPVTEAEFLKPLFEIVDRVYAEPLAP